MLFNSLEFILAFLPITFLVYFWLNQYRLILAGKSWLVLASAVMGHLIVLGLSGGWPLLRSMLTLNLRSGDLPKHWPQQVWAFIRRRGPSGGRQPGP